MPTEATSATRSAEEVFMSHLRNRMDGNLDADIRDNYAEDVVVLTGYGIFNGLDGVRKSASILKEQLEHTKYVYRTRLVHGRMAFLEWAAESPKIRVSDGADSYLIEDGRIKVQTIHYTLISGGQ